MLFISVYLKYEVRVLSISREFRISGGYAHLPALLSVKSTVRSHKDKGFICSQARHRH